METSKSTVPSTDEIAWEAMMLVEAYDAALLAYKRAGSTSAVMGLTVLGHWVNRLRDAVDPDWRKHYGE